MAALEGSIQLLVKTAAAFALANGVLLVGQIGIESDDLLTTPKFKIGDGTTAWNTLPYFTASSGGGSFATITGSPNDNTDLDELSDILLQNYFN